MNTFLIHGLTVRSEVPLSAHVQPPGSASDVSIRVEPAVELAEPRGDRIAGIERDGARYSAWRIDGGYLLSFPGLCEFGINCDTTEIVARTLRAAEPELVSLLVLGNVLAFVLGLRSRLVLHASAVETRAGTVAIIGGSGAGKSTIAACLCSQGARLVSDDALHVTRGEHGWICHRGSTELRLRRNAPAILPSGTQYRQCFDGRTASVATPSARAVLPISAMLWPRLTDQVPPHPISRVNAHEAFLAIVKNPRLQGWSDAAVLETQMHLAADLARSVPAHAIILERDAALRADLSRRIEAALTP